MKDPTKVTKVERYGQMVHEHSEMDELRRSECLCLNCANLKDCDIAKAGYQLCITRQIAYMMTRCPQFEYLSILDS